MASGGGLSLPSNRIRHSIDKVVLVFAKDLLEQKQALRDRDHIRAVILGAGINNDGNDKVGYTAPSFRGQAAAMHSISTRAPRARPVVPNALRAGLWARKNVA